MPMMDNLRGINVAGAEFGKPGDPYGEGYIYPTKETIDSLASDKFNAIRLPFLWERLQPQLNGILDDTELSRTQQTVDGSDELGFLRLRYKAPGETGSSLQLPWVLEHASAGDALRC